jgi:diguanylate cyclase (GGDEF)-like protein
MALYNAFFLYCHGGFANIRPLNQAQMLLDLFFVTIVVHFSGGAVSWFWPMYLVVTIESVLVMEKHSDAFAFALGASLTYGGLLQLEYLGVITPVSMPFENLALQKTLPYCVMKWAWVTMIDLSVAAIGVFLIRTIRQREDRLKKLVTRDNLTDLYNRGYFFYRLNSELQRAKRYKRALSLLILDLDDFKQVNDRYGHLAGDQLLRMVSTTIRTNIRYSTGRPSYELDIPCRYGGDEFAVIVPEALPSQAAAVAERLRNEIRTKCGREMTAHLRSILGAEPVDMPAVSVSVGVASFPDHAVESEALVKAADDAMYESKRAEKDRVAVSRSPAAVLT